MSSLSHVFMLVGDLAEARRFYVDLIGLAVLAEDGGYLRVGGGGGFHMGMEQGGVGRVEGGPEINVQVVDVDAEYARLTAAGVPFEGSPADQEWGARHAWLRDPDGRRLSIFSGDKE
jgi:catechol 2,3-dioxygenase-like lactoylglutathione lyase family enzyme